MTHRGAAVAALVLPLCAIGARAATLDDIGYTELAALLGTGLPDGSGVPVSLVEANIDTAPAFSYLPDTTLAVFSGKTINDASLLSNAGPSSHATGVSRRFFGNFGSQAPGVTVIDGYLTENWLQTGYLNFVPLAVVPGPQPLSSSSRVANHSWIGTFGGSTEDSEVLRRTDWVVERDEHIQVAAFTGNVNNGLLGSARNVIAVNRTGLPTDNGSNGYDADYPAGRVRPDLVAPEANPSNATAVVSSSVALLAGLGHDNPGLSNDPAANSTTNRAGDTIYNAERSEVIKAGLMAGATRQTANTADSDISDYRANAVDRTANGLDRRYGAGQLNILNSYRIIAGGEQNSLEDDLPGMGVISSHGFDYDPSFGGGSGSNDEATYFIGDDIQARKLIASLVWNIEIDGGNAAIFDGSATLHDLDLLLFDVTDPNNWLLTASSASSGDNTENLWLDLAPNREYALQVQAAAGQSPFAWDYGLAWRIQPVPLPGGALLFVSAMGWLAARRRASRPAPGAAGTAAGQMSP